MSSCGQARALRLRRLATLVDDAAALVLNLTLMIVIAVAVAVTSSTHLTQACGLRFQSGGLGADCSRLCSSLRRRRHIIVRVVVDENRLGCLLHLAARHRPSQHRDDSSKQRKDKGPVCVCVCVCVRVCVIDRWANCSHCRGKIDKWVKQKVAVK